jgi:hypothetical protein
MQSLTPTKVTKPPPPKKAPVKKTANWRIEEFT